jgi:hypothetical protein
MRVCLPDLADTVPAVFVGLISAPVARSADVKSSHHVFDAHLGLRSLTRDEAERESVQVISSSMKQS